MTHDSPPESASWCHMDFHPFDGVSPLNSHRSVHQCRLKYCTSRSCCLAASMLANVPRLRRFPVCAFFFLEYKRNCPDLSLRIMLTLDARNVIPVAHFDNSVCFRYLLLEQRSQSAAHHTTQARRIIPKGVKSQHVYSQYNRETLG